MVSGVLQVFSRNARQVNLCLLRRDGSGYLEMALHPGEAGGVGWE